VEGLYHEMKVRFKATRRFEVLTNIEKCSSGVIKNGG